MTDYHLSYSPQDGFIHNWLVAGPHAVPVQNMDQFEGADFKAQIARHYRVNSLEVTDEPCHWTNLSLDDTEHRWQSYSCLDDHFVDLSCFYHTCHHLRAWAYAVIDSPSQQTVSLTLTTNAPADIWLDGQHVHRQEKFSHQRPYGETVDVTLKRGRNPIMVRFEGVASRECPYVMALQISGTTEALTVQLPISTDNAERHQIVEQILAEAYFDRDVFNYNEKVVLRWGRGLKRSNDYSVRIQQPDGRIFAELQRVAKPGEAHNISNAVEFPDNTYEAFLIPHPLEYYEQGVRVDRRIPLSTVRNKYEQAPHKSDQKRRGEALEAAARRRNNIYADIARMALNSWVYIDTEKILQTIAEINQRQDCSDFYLVGLLGMVNRFSDHEKFPQELLQPLEDCILNFKYWIDEPGNDSMCTWSENHQILFHTCEILAGQMYPDRVFSNNGQTGEWHREKGERLALGWLRKRAAHGFQEWDSNCYFEHDVLALIHLIDFAETEAVWELAAVVLDKILLTMALNSFKGVFGSTHGRTYTPHIKSAYLEPTSGIGRLMWGQGVYNSHILATVSLACSDNYELPPIIASIATHLPEEMWSKERHAGEFEEAIDLKTGSWDVNKVTYKTPDYMLCSVQDYHPGEAGYQQHIWQATMGPDALVFANHPSALNENGAHRPGSWHGNVILPRVAQWHDTLIAIHDLGEDDWLNFTHAYFPVYAFDEYKIEDGWAFARKDDGYLALTAAQGIELITMGNNAFRELRSHGQHNIWLCQMGRAALDESFSNFQKRILAIQPTFAESAVSFTNLRGHKLAFGWEGSFLVDDEAQPLSGFRHYDGPFCAAEWPAEVMAVGFEQQIMRLNLSG